MTEQEAEQTASAETPAETVSAEVPETNAEPPSEITDTPQKTPKVLETPAETPSSLPPSTPNLHNLPTPVDYEKLLMSDDDEIYTEDNFPDDDAPNLPDDNATAASNTSMIEMISASVTSNFTAKFFPPSPARSKDIEQGGAGGSADAGPAPTTPARSLLTPTPASTPASASRDPPPDYIVNRSSDQYDDDISTLANETIIGKYMNNTTANRPGVPDVSSGASQLSEMHPAAKEEKPAHTDSDPSSPNPSSPSKSTVVGELEDKSAFSFKRFRRGGGSGWTRRTYKLAFCLTIFLLAMIAGLAYAFHRLKVKEDEVANNKRKKSSVTPGMVDELPDGMTFRPTTEPTPIPIGPTPRPTRAPTNVPSRRPSSSPSVGPTNRPTTEPSARPTSTPSVVPTYSPEGYLRQLLAETTSERTLELIDIRNTPQQLAFEWMINDPNFMNYLRRRQTQRFALAVLYYTNVRHQDALEAMQTWMSYDTNECSWFTSWYENRLACGSDDVFKFLTLRNINLIGTIPAELAMLTKLESLVLRDNGLTGKIPKEFFEWKSLSKLWKAILVGND